MIAPPSPFELLYRAIQDFMRRQRADRDRNPPADGAVSAPDDLSGLVAPNVVLLGRDSYFELKMHRDAVGHFERDANGEKVMGLRVVRAYDDIRQAQVAYVPGLR